jgi:hypothetical protein
MSTFTDKQQATHRKAFIEDCRQNALNASCNADYNLPALRQANARVSDLDEGRSPIRGTDQIPRKLAEYHTKENREQRKTLQELRNVTARQLESLEGSADEAHRAVSSFMAPLSIIWCLHCTPKNGSGRKV